MKEEIENIEKEYKIVKQKVDAGEITEGEYKKEIERINRELSHLKYKIDEKEARRSNYFMGFLFLLSISIVFGVYHFASLKYHAKTINVEADGFAPLPNSGWEFTSLSYIVGGEYDWRLHDVVPKSYKGRIKYLYRVNWEETAPMTHDILLAWEDYANDSLVKYDHMAWNIPYVGGRIAFSRLTEEGMRLKREGRLKGGFYQLHAIPASPEIYKALNELSNGDNVRIAAYYSEGITIINKDNGWEAFTNGGCHEVIVMGLKLLDTGKL